MFVFFNCLLFKSISLLHLLHFITLLPFFLSYPSSVFPLLFLFASIFPPFLSFLSQLLFLLLHFFQPLHFLLSLLLSLPFLPFYPSFPCSPPFRPALSSFIFLHLYDNISNNLVKRSIDALIKSLKFLMNQIIRNWQ